MKHRIFLSQKKREKKEEERKQRKSRRRRRTRRRRPRGRWGRKRGRKRKILNIQSDIYSSGDVQKPLSSILISSSFHSNYESSLHALPLFPPSPSSFPSSTTPFPSLPNYFLSKLFIDWHFSSDDFFRVHFWTNLDDVEEEEVESEEEEEEEDEEEEEERFSCGNNEGVDL